jgi:hypothetical protein
VPNRSLNSIGANDHQPRLISAMNRMFSAPWVHALGSVALAGCAEITGVDEYGIAGAPETTLCPSPQAPAGPEGQCTAAGVLDCGEWFTADGRGGCESPATSDACRPGFHRNPGTTECIPGASSCFGRYNEALAPAQGWLYVDAAAPASGDGLTKDTPFKTINDAVRSAGPATVGIAIAVGDYEETLEVTKPLRFAGACAGPQEDQPPTRLRAPAQASGAVVKFSLAKPGEAGITAMEITGGRTGVAAEGPVTLTFDGVWIHDVDGPGVRLGEGVKARMAVLVEHAVGAGIELEGSTLDSRYKVSGGATVRRIRPLADGTEGYGIALYPARKLTDVPNLTPTAPFRFTSAQSEITLDGAVLEDNAGAGLFVEGSTAVVSRSVIRNTHANGLGEGRGIVVQRRALGPIAASLELEQSLVEGNSDAGVLVVDSPAPIDGTPGVSVTIENTTIRDVSGNQTAPEGTPCVGNGLRVRADGATSDAAIVLKNSLIEGTHEAGVHVQGARVDVSGSIVRGTAACAADYGDGIAVLGDALLPAALRVTGSRVEGNARAGVASFGAEVDVASSIIEAADGKLIAKVDRGGVPGTASASATACAVGDTKTACRIEQATLAPPLVGGNGCAAFAAEGVCYRGCWDDVWDRLNSPAVDRSKAVSPLGRLVFWARDALHLGASITAADGCVEWGGLPPSSPKRVWALARDGYVPFTWWQTTGSIDSSPMRFGVPGNGLRAPIASTTEEDFDSRMGPWIGVAMCQPLDSDFDRTPTELCAGRGVEGVRLQAETPGTTGPWYTTSGNVLQQEGSITSASFALFVNGPPGDFVVRLLPPPTGGAVECTGDGFGTGWSNADLIGPDRVRLPVRPGFGASTGALFCSVK